jgi:hypothetical protein
MKSTKRTKAKTDPMIAAVHDFQVREYARRSEWTMKCGAIMKNNERELDDISERECNAACDARCRMDETVAESPAGLLLFLNTVLSPLVLESHYSNIDGDVVRMLQNIRKSVQRFATQAA